MHYVIEYNCHPNYMSEHDEFENIHSGEISFSQNVTGLSCLHAKNSLKLKYCQNPTQPKQSRSWFD